MTKLLVALAVFMFTTAQAQPNQWYVAAKAGLNIREKADLNSRSIGKIPYAEKIQLDPTTDASLHIITEGMHGYWRRVNFENKTGYIIDCYLLPIPPPVNNIKTVKEYLLQLASPFGAELLVKGGDLENPEEGGTETRKQLFSNGGEWHSYQAPEYGSVTAFVPELNVQQGFLLVRLLSEFEAVFTGKDEFPGSSRKINKSGTDYQIKVDKEMIGNFPWIKKITVEFEPAAIYTFELYQIDNQLVIFYGAGV